MDTLILIVVCKNVQEHLAGTIYVPVSVKKIYSISNRAFMGELSELVLMSG